MTATLYRVDDPLAGRVWWIRLRSRRSREDALGWWRDRSEAVAYARAYGVDEVLVEDDDEDDAP